MKARFTPRTSFTAFNTCSAWPRSTSRSSPNTLITICPSICEIDSSTLSRIGCEKLGSIPGKRDIDLSISSISCRLDAPPRQWDSGFRLTRISHMLIGLGSVPSSGLPHLEMTVSTSGTDASTERNRPLMRCASVTETDVGSVTLIQIEPSFSSGRNSVPSLGTTARLAASAASAVPRTFFLLSIAQASAGS